MLALVWHALRARRAQSLTLFALALLAGLGSAAAPWFLAWGSDAVARANVASSPAMDRLVVLGGSERYDSSAPAPVSVMRDQVAEHLAVTDAEVAVGLRVLADVAEAGSARDISTYVAYYDEACQRMTIAAGTCPTAAGEVVIARSVAESLGLEVGDAVSIDVPRMPAATLRVSGVYEVADPLDAYWVGTQLLPVPGESRTADPAFVSEETLLAMLVDGVDVEPRAHVVLPDGAFMTGGAELVRHLRQAAAELYQEDIELATSASSLVNRIAYDRRWVAIGVGVGAAQLVLVCWVGLFLAVRHTSAERRADIGLLKLRGTANRRVWALVALQSVLPVLAGTLLGAAAGFGVVAALASRTGGSSAAGLLDVTSGQLSTGQTAALSVAAAALSGLGVLAAVVAEWRTVRRPVVELMRYVPARRRGWRADAAEVLVVVLAGAGVYQAHAEADKGAQASVFALLAPALVGIAVALLVARALLPVASRVGAAALRAGRPGVALGALHLARRQGMHRVFAVLVVAGAVFTTATIGWRSASAAWQQRAELELGASRVLTVDAPGPAALLAAVRAVDPEGRYAMAVAGTVGRDTDERTLVLDATRLARVGHLPAGAPPAEQVAALLRPPAPEPPMIVDGPIVLDAAVVEALDEPPTGDLEPVPLHLRLHLSTMDGTTQAMDLPTLVSGRSTVEATVGGCAEGCRLVALQVSAPSAVVLPNPVTVHLHELRQADGAVLSSAMLGDVARWRTTLAYPATPPEISARDGRLEITVPAGAQPGSTGVNGWVVPLSAPSPLPAVVAGPPPEDNGGDPRVAVLGGSPVPFRIVATVPFLPRLGNRGMLMDLEYALRSNDTALSGTSLSVWLTADAPGSLVAALAEHGVTVGDESSVADRTADFAGDGPGLALLFQYLAAAAVLLLAAGVAVVGSTVERSHRVAELAALRAQGLSSRSVRGAGVADAAVLVGAATVTGVLAALLAQLVVTTSVRIFSDEFTLLPVPPGATLATLALSAAVVAAAVGIGSLTAAGRLVAAVSRTVAHRTGSDRTGSGRTAP